MQETTKLSEYNGTFDADVIKKMHSAPNEIDVETMKKCLYGYTYTKEYAKHKVPDEFFMDYWVRENFKFPSPFDFVDLPEMEESSDDDEDSEELVEPEELEEDDSLGDLDPYIVSTPQEKLLLRAIDSTGDGKTPETALCVVDVHQEYEYLSRVFDYMGLTVKRQSLMDGGIDRLEFAKNDEGIKEIYFDISCRFKRSRS